MQRDLFTPDHQAFRGQYTDARVARIYAGTSEVRKVMIAKSLGL